MANSIKSWINFDLFFKQKRQFDELNLFTLNIFVVIVKGRNDLINQQ